MHRWETVQRISVEHTRRITCDKIGFETYLQNFCAAVSLASKGMAAQL